MPFIDGFKSTSQWMSEHWRSGCALIYSLIVVADFIIFPAWIGLNRVDLFALLEAMEHYDTSIQREVLNNAFRRHTPFTLENAGLVHLSFGAILTGAAVTNKSKVKE